MTSKILLLEDEEQIGEKLERILNYEGYEVDRYMKGDEAVAAAITNDYDLMILDIMLKNQKTDSSVTNGLEVARVIKRHKEIPYIFLTSRREPYEIIQSLDAGAEDFITKPYDIAVLLARLRKVFRKNSSVYYDVETSIDLQTLRIDLIHHKVHVRDQEVAVSPHLFKLLVYFAKNKGKILTKEEIYNNVWGENYTTGTDTGSLGVSIKRLRQLIGTDYIKAIRGVGYRFEEPIS